MTFPVNKIQFGQQTLPSVQGIKPRSTEVGFGMSQPLGADLNISKPGLNPFGQLSPVRQNENLGNKLDLFG